MAQNLNDAVAQRLNIDKAKAGIMLAAFADIVKEAMLEGDTVALPGFGTFVTNKVDEEITVDPTTHEKTLRPPRLEVNFIPALKFAKSVKQQ